MTLIQAFTSLILTLLGMRLNESTYGLIHQYFPKDRDLTTVPEAELAMNKPNYRPRLSLGFTLGYLTGCSLTPRLR